MRAETKRSGPLRLAGSPRAGRTRLVAALAVAALVAVCAAAVVTWHAGDGGDAVAAPSNAYHLKDKINVEDLIEKMSSGSYGNAITLDANANIDLLDKEDSSLSGYSFYLNGYTLRLHGQELYGVRLNLTGITVYGGGNGTLQYENKYNESMYVYGTCTFDSVTVTAGGATSENPSADSGAFIVRGTLNLDNTKITARGTTSNYMVWIVSSGTLSLKNSTISSCGTDFPAVFVGAGSGSGTGSVIVDGSASSIGTLGCGNGSIVGNCSIQMKGGTIQRITDGTTGTDADIDVVMSGGKIVSSCALRNLTATGGEITNAVTLNGTSSIGGTAAIASVTNNGTLTMSGGTVSSSGGTGVTNNGTFTMSGGTISGSAYGVKADSGTVTVAGGSSPSNTRTGVRVASGATLVLKGGSVHGNGTSGNGYAGVEVASGGKLDCTDSSARIYSNGTYGLSYAGTDSLTLGAVQISGNSVTQTVSEIRTAGDLVLDGTIVSATAGTALSLGAGCNLSLDGGASVRSDGSVATSDIGTLTLKDGSVESDSAAFTGAISDLTVEGGSITATEDVFSGAVTAVSVTGGTLRSETGNVFAKEGTGTVEISGGSVIAAAYAFTGTVATLVIRGGTVRNGDSDGYSLKASSVSLSGNVSISGGKGIELSAGQTVSLAGALTGGPGSVTFTCPDSSMAQAVQRLTDDGSAEYASSSASAFTFHGNDRIGIQYYAGDSSDDAAAIWVGYTYIVHFESNHDETEWGTQTVLADKGSICTIVSVPRTGYTFLGYNTTSTASEATIGSDNGWLVNLLTSREAVSQTDITVYAVWQAHTYTIHLMPNGGDGEEIVIAMTYGQPYTLPMNTYTLLGMVFIGWALDPDAVEVKYTDGEVLYDVTPEDGAEVFLYAVWVHGNYTVVFDANGGTGTMDPQAMEYGTGVNLSINRFVYTGYTFLGWARDKTATVAEYYDGEYVLNVIREKTDTVVLYAVWAAHSYKISFDANGGTGTMIEQAVAFGTEVVLRTNGFAKPGYTFLGWSLESGAEKATWADGATIGNLTTEDGATVKLYAIWYASFPPTPPSPGGGGDDPGTGGDTGGGESGSDSASSSETTRTLMIAAVAGAAVLAMIILVLWTDTGRRS